MAIIPVDNTHIITSITSDAQYLRSFIQWTAQRYQAYNTMCTPTAMTAANIAAGDQTLITNFTADLGRILLLSQGTLPAAAENINNNIVQLLGLT